MLHPLIKILDWYKTTPEWREARKRIPGALGLGMLAEVKNEAHLGAREIGGNNRGPWIVKYGGKEGQAWCGRLIRWSCVRVCAQFKRETVPLPDTGGARRLFRAALRHGYAVAEEDVLPGDLVLFDRGVIGRAEDKWKAHIGIMDDEPGYYWAGNEGPFPARVERHRLTPAKRKRLEGWARLP
jgi:hypothetical protein